MRKLRDGFAQAFVICGLSLALSSSALLGISIPYPCLHSQNNWIPDVRDAGHGEAFRGCGQVVVITNMAEI
jgi:hypothetical protein